MGLIDIAFILLSAVAVISGWRVFVTDSMVRASFLLLLSFVAVALIILLMAAPYIGVATIFMMAVEMMVMALFMVMFMMNPAGLNPMMMVHQNRFAIGAGVVAFAGLSLAALATDFVDNRVDPAKRVVHDLGIELLGPSMLTFETAGVTLLATMVGAVVLSARSGRFGASDEGSLPPGLEPGGEPAGRKPEESGGHHHHHHMHG
ncbi:NADH-quinone oxidoreductase subunit J family protein [Consotaella salsifontis]|uniref:NADH-quinone oxidoreductase subunit J n=1 Tax=Consotaella salsifontis TaxID=1365950 RepID=A0A1T4RM62_9HYPH|nr:NADH-quinone oxidoreductase subunit J [Consotaella salsifontis]SKA17090.1 NADH dehydrogenase subunit J [Consotaella salsifontis]